MQTSDSKTKSKSDPDDGSSCTIPLKMRRVDWRWAAAKGFLNKETNQWNEEMGGQEAYLKQRNDRMMARSVIKTCRGPFVVEFHKIFLHDVLVCISQRLDSYVLHFDVSTGRKSRSSSRTCTSCSRSTLR